MEKGTITISCANEYGFPLDFYVSEKGYGRMLEMYFSGCTCLVTAGNLELVCMEKELSSQTHEFQNVLQGRTL